MHQNKLSCPLAKDYSLCCISFTPVAAIVIKTAADECALFQLSTKSPSEPLQRA